MSQGAQPSVKLPLRTVLGIDFPVVEIGDVGAMAEGEDRFAALLAQGLANVSAFEPNPAELAKLEALRTPRRRYFPYFLGRGGPATFHLTRYPGCSSLYEPDPLVIDVFTSIGATLPWGNFAVKKTEPVETTRLEDIRGLPAVIDYLKLDVQGAELDVLAGAGRVLDHTLVIDLEAEFIPLYKNQPLFGDVQVFLRDKGFVLHKFVDISGRCFKPLCPNGNQFASMSQILWADAIFVKDFTRLESYSDEQLLKVALILYEVYCSYDLVFRVLAEYDRRCSSNHAGNFGQWLARQEGLPLMYLNQVLHPRRVLPPVKTEPKA